MDIQDQDDIPEELDQDFEEDSIWEWIKIKLHALPWFIVSLIAHGVLFFLAYFIMGTQPIVPEVKIEINTRLQAEKTEEFKPEQKTDIFQTSRPNIESEDSPNVEDPVIVKDAQEADHNERDTDEDYQMSKGNLQAMSDSPLDGISDNSEIGVGTGSGGMFGDRFGGRQNLVKKGGSAQTESAVHIGLLWLKRHQLANGRWSGRFQSCCDKDTKYPGTCNGEAKSDWIDPGLTGLALLCFLGAGNSTTVGEFKSQVKLGTQYLMENQDSEGCFGPQKNNYMYNHAIATLAMAEAYTLSNYNPLLRESAQNGVNFLVSAQNPNKGWRYHKKDGQNDTSVTGWCVMALKSAKAGKLDVPDQSLEWARSFLDEMTDSTYYYTGYTERGKQYVNIPECMTAVAMTSRVFMGADSKDSYLIGGAGLLQTSLPNWSPVQGNRNPVDYYYWYYGTLAMYQVGGDYWTTWNDKMKGVLLDHQCRGGCSDGSWPTEDRWSEDGSRVYATAINILSLEIYYRYAKVFK